MVHRTLEQILYTCGSKLDIEPIIHRGDPPTASTVFTRVMVRMNLTCNDLVEIPYYSSNCFEYICVHCACHTQCNTDGQYPICNDCKGDGKPPVFKQEKTEQMTFFNHCMFNSYVFPTTFLCIFKLEKKKEKPHPLIDLRRNMPKTSNSFCLA